MSYNIFLDDVRRPSSTQHVELPLYEWTIVRSYDEFIRTINSRGLPGFITFDHDLAIEHYPKTLNEMDIQHKIDYTSMLNKTGYHCALWLIDYCMMKGLRLPRFMVHSMNPAGKQNIIQVLNEFKQYQDEQEKAGFIWKQI